MADRYSTAPSISDAVKGGRKEGVDDSANEKEGGIWCVRALQRGPSNQVLFLYKMKALLAKEFLEFKPVF